MVRIVSASKERVGLTGPDAVDVDALQIGALRSVFPGAAEKIHGVPARDDAAEDFLEVKLSTTCLRVFVVLPIEYEYSH